MNNDLKALAREAYIWGIPLVQTRLYLQRARELDLPFNQLFVSADLSTPESEVPLPNVDTLYGLGWLDLTEEPILMSVPDTDDRYYLLQLNDAYLNSFSYIGRRTTGTEAGEFAIVGPGWSGELPEGVTRVDAPTNHVLALSRVLVNGEQDVENARAVQDQFCLTPLSAYPKFLNPSRPIVDAFNNFPILQPNLLGLQYFDELCAGLAENPPPVEDHALIRDLEVLSIAAGGCPSQTVDATVKEAMLQAIDEAHNMIHSRAGWLIDTRDVNGWRVSYGIRSFIEDPLDRAVVAKLGPGCLVPQEGLYFSMLQGPDEQPLSGDKRYLLEFPKEALPPVDAFWSLTLYSHDWALVDNPIDRYAIGDRTPGLQFNSDGSLSLYIQHEEPEQGPQNWLPCPDSDAGPFHLFLRTYQPQPILADGRYQMPPVQLV